MCETVFHEHAGVRFLEDWLLSRLGASGRPDDAVDRALHLTEASHGQIDVVGRFAAGTSRASLPCRSECQQSVRKPALFEKLEQVDYVCCVQGGPV